MNFFCLWFGGFPDTVDTPPPKYATGCIVYNVLNNIVSFIDDQMSTIIYQYYGGAPGAGGGGRGGRGGPGGRGGRGGQKTKKTIRKSKYT